MTSKKDLKRIKELKKEISFYGELSTSESKDKESYKRLVEDLKKELESLEKKMYLRKQSEDSSTELIPPMSDITIRTYSVT